MRSRYLSIWSLCVSFYLRAMSSSRMLRKLFISGAGQRVRRERAVALITGGGRRASRSIAALCMFIGFRAAGRTAGLKLCRSIAPRCRQDHLEAARSTPVPNPPVSKCLVFEQRAAAKLHSASTQVPRARASSNRCFATRQLPAAAIYASATRRKMCTPDSPPGVWRSSHQPEEHT